MINININIHITSIAPWNVYSSGGWPRHLTTLFIASIVNQMLSAPLESRIPDAMGRIELIASIKVESAVHSGQSLYNSHGTCPRAGVRNVVIKLTQRLLENPTM